MKKIVVKLEAHTPELNELKKLTKILKKEGWEFNSYGNENDTMVLAMSRWVDIEKAE